MRMCPIEDLDLPEAVIKIVQDSLADGYHNAWQLGRVELSQGCFVNVEDGDTRFDSDARFEAHDNYVDVQYVVSGDGESMQWTKRDELTPGEDLLEESDLLFFDEPRHPRSITSIAVSPGQALVFMPNDAHKPSLPIAEVVCRRRKYVYKIPLSFFVN